MSQKHSGTAKMSDQERTKKTPDQERANDAWNRIKSVKEQLSKDEQRDYAGEARKLPVRIMASGLGQALAFIRAKAASKKESLGRLHDDLSDWVLNTRLPAAKNPDGLLGAVIHGDSDFLRRATDETLAYLAWLNRFAEAEKLTEGAE
jgi:CRISPR-associated protein Cmr5